MKIYIYLSILLTSLLACSTPKQEHQPPLMEFETTIQRQLPPILIYRTRQDYSRNVPIIMNKEKTQIVSYPAPSDICLGGHCAYPTPLDDNFWLDNRGISPNVVFLSYTYDEYAALSSTPSLETLHEQIIDFTPLTELYNCGNQIHSQSLTEELNKLIREKAYKKKENLAK